MSFDTHVERFSALLQAKFIPKSRIVQYCRKILSMDKPAEFYLNRLQGIGGSEVGAIVAYYYGASIDKDLNKTLFKDAQAIAKEKLLLSLPYSTEASRRGNRIEPFIRHIVEIKYPHLKRREDLMSLAGQHKHCKFALGNTDDIFETESNKIVLFDYKSSISSDTDETFSNIAQLNHYAEILRSHDQDPESSFTVKLRAENEAIFQDIINAYDNRIDDPDTFNFWVNAIANDKLMSVKLDFTPVELTPEFGQLCIQATDRFFEEFILNGSLLAQNNEQTLVVNEEAEEATRLEGLIFHINAAEKAVGVLKGRVLDQIQEFRDNIGQPFNWPSKFPIRIKESIQINEAAAVEALELSGFDTASLYVTSERGEIDSNALLEKFKSIGGVVDQSLFTKKLSEPKVIAALQQCGIDKSAFQVSSKVSATLSRYVSDSEQKFFETAEYAQSLYKLVNQNTTNDVVNLQEHVQASSSDMGMNQ